MDSLFGRKYKKVEKDENIVKVKLSVNFHKLEYILDKEIEIGSDQALAIKLNARFFRTILENLLIREKDTKKLSLKIRYKDEYGCIVKEELKLKGKYKIYKHQGTTFLIEN